MSFGSAFSIGGGSAFELASGTISTSKSMARVPPKRCQRPIWAMAGSARPARRNCAPLHLPPLLLMLLLVLMLMLLLLLLLVLLLE